MTATTPDPRGADGPELGVLTGDGIGPEIVPAAVQVVDAALASLAAPGVRWRELPMGLAAIGSHGSPLPARTLQELDALDGWLLGPRRCCSTGRRRRRRRRREPRLTGAAERIDTAVRTVVRNGTSTPDLGGSASTAEFTSAVVTELTASTAPTASEEASAR